jgi:Dolichyl-phosphate-mannose-protein mannosyltransferase
MRTDESPAPRTGFTSAMAIVLYIAAANLLLHLLTAGRYGFFRDELYYLDCAEHLDWGYVDQPPLIALIAWVVRHLLGQSLLAVRLFPALAGAALVWLTGKLAAEMGGGRFAQALAALAVAVVPFYLILQHWLTMNAFEPLIWMGCAWCVIRAVNTENARYWLLFGVLAGVGMENKYSIAFFVFGIVAGLLLTPARRVLASSWMWWGAAAAFTIFIPNLIWLVRHGFPFLEFMHAVRMSGRDIARAPLAFIGDQAMVHNPVLFPLWLAGLLWLLLARRAQRYRVLGIAFVAVLAAFILLKGKNYYLSPVYPMMFAAGAAGLEDFTRDRWRWVRLAYPALILLTGALIAPIMLPILSPESMIRYQKALGYPPPEFEHQRHGPLPQYFADEFGWEEMARETSRVYHRLSPDEQAKAVIFANDYGEAAAINFFGPRYGLPRAICNHQTYWLWGPGSAKGDIVIVLGSDGAGDREHFRSVEVAGQIGHPYSRVDEHFTIWLCRGLLFDIRQAWPGMKNWS